MTPAILGLSHVSLSVPAREASRRFWIDVMGFELVEESEGFCFVFDRGARLAVIMSDHGGRVSGPFDELNAGLDHIALAVPEVEALHAWEQRLANLGVPHSPIAETDAGHHLNLRAPDNVPVELFVMKREFATALGLEETIDAVAATH